MRIKAGVDESGQLVAWETARAGANISPDTFRTLLPAMYPWLGDFLVEGVANASEIFFENFSTDESSTEGLFEDYDQPNTRVTHMTVDHGLPLTFWRAVGHSYTAFATWAHGRVYGRREPCAGGAPSNGCVVVEACDRAMTSIRRLSEHHTI